MLFGLLCVFALLLTFLGGSYRLLRWLISLLVWLIGLVGLVWLTRLVGRIHRRKPSAQATHDGGSQRSQHHGNADGKQDPRPEADREAEREPEQPHKALEAAIGCFVLIGAKSAQQRSEGQADKQDGQKDVPCDATQENGHRQSNDKNAGSEATQGIPVGFSIVSVLLHHNLFLLSERQRRFFSI